MQNILKGRRDRKVRASIRLKSRKRVKMSLNSKNKKWQDIIVVNYLAMTPLTSIMSTL